MKKSYLLFFGVFFSFICFAQAATTASQNTAPAPTAAPAPAAKTITGKVDSIHGDGNKGVRSDITIEDDNGRSLNVVIKFGTMITGKDGKPASFSDIKEGSKVTVEYITKSSGTNKAESVRLEE